MHTELKILLAKKDDTLRADYAAYLETLGYVVEQARDGEEIQAICHQMKFDVILLDDHLAGSGNGFHAVSEMNPDNNGPGMIAFIEDMDKFDASKAVAAGISDWVSDRGDHDEFRARLERTIRDLARRQALVQKQRESEKIKMEMEYVLQGLKEIVRGQKGFILPDRVKKREDFPAIIGNSREIEKVLELVRLVAQTNATVLITGESGTGKELITRAIHSQSPRTDHPFVPINCAALSETLLESELFGHEKGAFTGAQERKIGKFELAHKGTIFLDEIAEMHTGMQAKMLRVLQEGVFYRLGGNVPIHVDVRVIAATNKEIAKEVAEGRFREDLFYRLNVVQIQMPSLRERKADIALLSEYFLDLFRKERGATNLCISKKAMDKMTDYHWPGNVRELRNAIERGVVLGNGSEILPDDLPMFDNDAKYPGLQVGLTLQDAINTFKKEFIRLNLENTGGSRSKAAKVLGIQRTYLSSLVSKYELN